MRDRGRVRRRRLLKPGRAEVEVEAGGGGAPSALRTPGELHHYNHSRPIFAILLERFPRPYNVTTCGPQEGKLEPYGSARSG
jgi:hypothetical protein